MYFINFRLCTFVTSIKLRMPENKIRTLYIYTRNLDFIRMKGANGRTIHGAKRDQIDKNSPSTDAGASEAQILSNDLLCRKRYIQNNVPDSRIYNENCRELLSLSFFFPFLQGAWVYEESYRGTSPRF